MTKTDFSVGKKAARQYRSVPTNALEENYRELYNLSAYREMLYRNVLQTSPETVKEVWVNESPHLPLFLPKTVSDLSHLSFFFLSIHSGKSESDHTHSSVAPLSSINR